MLSPELRVSLGRFLQRHFPSDHTRQCLAALDQYGRKFTRETEWSYVRQIAGNSILASRTRSQRISKILGPAASTLSILQVVVSIEFVKLGPRYQTMNGPKQLSSLFNIGLAAIEELHGGGSAFGTDVYFEEMKGLKRDFDSAMDHMSKEYLTKRGRAPL